MRLDKFLKVSRLIKRRTVAGEIADKGKISVNGQVAKPAKQLKEGDILTFCFANSTKSVRILKIPETAVPVQEASSLYEEISPE